MTAHRCIDYSGLFGVDACVDVNSFCQYVPKNANETI